MARWIWNRKPRKGDWSVDVAINSGAAIIFGAIIWMFYDKTFFTVTNALLLGIGLVIYAAAWWINIIMHEVQDITCWIKHILEGPKEEGDDPNDMEIDIGHIRKLLRLEHRDYEWRKTMSELDKSAS